MFNILYPLAELTFDSDPGSFSQVLQMSHMLLSCVQTFALLFLGQGGQAEEGKQEALFHFVAVRQLISPTGLVSEESKAVVIVFTPPSNCHSGLTVAPFSSLHKWLMTFIARSQLSTEPTFL